MDLYKISDQTWEDLILEKINFDFHFLALKILLSRLRLKAKTNSSPQSIRGSGEEIKNLFVRFKNLPAAQRDFQKILEYKGVANENIV